MFENDVKMYGIQAATQAKINNVMFENDVKMYGIQASIRSFILSSMFENDVKMYGIQASLRTKRIGIMFENDVEMYGIQDKYHLILVCSTHLRSDSYGCSPVQLLSIVEYSNCVYWNVCPLVNVSLVRKN